jgi:hypothetical protein
MAFTGENTQGTVEAFIARLNFKANIDNEVQTRSLRNAATSQFAKCLKDFRFAERTAYGKIDVSGAPVVLAPDRDQSILKKVGSSDEVMVTAVNFVADAFSDMEKYFKAARQNNKIDITDPYLATPIPHKGYSSFELFKKDVRGNGYQAGFLSYIHEVENTPGTDINSFDVFMKNFIFYTDLLSYKIPFTKGELMKNKITPMRMSGLVVEIADGDFSKDNPIDILFYKSPNFDYFLNVAMKVGFSVDKNAPWRLVADLNSPTMKQRMNKYGLDGPDSFFTAYCRPAHENDFQEFIDFTLRLYGIYVDIKNRRTRPVRRGKLILTEPYRMEKVNEIQVYQNYGSDYFINRYIELKNIENRGYVGKRELEVLKTEIAAIGLLPLSKRDKHNRISATLEGKFKGFRGSGTLTEIKKSLVDIASEK